MNKLLLNITTVMSIVWRSSRDGLKSQQVGLEEKRGWVLLKARDPPEDLSMSCLGPLNAIDNTALILKGNFIIGHPVHRSLINPCVWSLLEACTLLPWPNPRSSLLPWPLGLRRRREKIMCHRHQKRDEKLQQRQKRIRRMRKEKGENASGDKELVMWACGWISQRE